jgi:hypothetical protein
MDHHHLSRIHRQILLLYYMERYRSGHNGAVLKTVRVQAHVGSNPTPSAIKKWRSTQVAEEVPLLRV